MARLELLADEYVSPSVLHDASIQWLHGQRAQDRYGQRNVDETILDDCQNEGLVVLTNDRDFVRLGTEGDHGGIVMYTDRNRLLDAPLEAVGAIERMNRYYSPDSIDNNVEWLESWL